MTDTNSAVDLGAIMPAETTTYEVRKPGSVEGSGWFIELGSQSHPKALAWAEDATRRNLRRAAKLEADQRNNRKVKPDEREPEDVRRENVEFVVSRIVTWSPVKIGDKTYDFSDAAATELLLRPDMGWVLQQILDVIGDETAFTKASAKS